MCYGTETNHFWPLLFEGTADSSVSRLSPEHASDRGLGRLPSREPGLLFLPDDGGRRSESRVVEVDRRGDTRLQCRQYRGGCCAPLCAARRLSFRGRFVSLVLWSWTSGKTMISALAWPCPVWIGSNIPSPRTLEWSRPLQLLVVALFSR